ncbi:MAG TPA: sigma-54-dependent Fis family transcriptional regulator, partial [Spirochaetia bacterium]|nr:sigma-54-dependent Fis family transcriptional regulator [Spirochaetia bacterium]
PRRESREVCQEVVQQVMDGCRSARIDGEEQGEGRKGKAQAQSVLCAPLTRNGKAIGCVYLDHHLPAVFNPDQQSSLEILALHGAVLLDNLAGRQRMHRERESLKSRLASKDETIVRSEKMVKLYEDIRTIAAINVPVFIQGEAGSGKEHVASALHNFSGRKGTYIPLNCAAIPEGIFESELFGSKKGAYHEAIDKPGKLELAEGGTLFLDEVADMSLILQPKLLRFLENGEIARLGDTRTRRLDVRVVTATNRDVAAMIHEKQFRDDLFQRLSCFTLKVPPLRERVEDIEPLARHFLERTVASLGKHGISLGPEAMARLKHYPWPGNVRELKHAIERAVLLCDDGAALGPRDFNLGDAGAPGKSIREMEADIERDSLIAALIGNNFNRSAAAESLKISRRTLYNRMKKHSLLGNGG